MNNDQFPKVSQLDDEIEFCENLSVYSLIQGHKAFYLGQEQTNFRQIIGISLSWQNQFNICLTNLDRQINFQIEDCNIHKIKLEKIIQSFTNYLENDYDEFQTNNKNTNKNDKNDQNKDNIDNNNNEVLVQQQDSYEKNYSNILGCTTNKITGLNYFVEKSFINNICFFSNNQENENNYFNFALNLNFQNCIVLSGSFNPPHAGHFQLMEETMKMFKNQENYNFNNIFFEIPIRNADKGEQNLNSLIKRSNLIFQQKFRNLKVILSKNQLFVDKVKTFQNSIFILGGDTFIRLIDKKYYNNSEEDLIGKLYLLKENNIKLVIAPRFDNQSQRLVQLNILMQNQQKNFDSSSSLFFPNFLKDQTYELVNFRKDISSSEIRNQENIKNISLEQYIQQNKE